MEDDKARKHDNHVKNANISKKHGHVHLVFIFDLVFEE
jgi:hypothetical protein